MAEKVTGQGIWNRVYLCVFAANVLLFLGMQMVNTLVAKYADYLGASATVVGLVSSLFALTALLFKVLSGPTLDAFSRKKILICAIGIIFIAFVGFSLSKSIEMLFAFRLLQGCGQAFTATCCLALAADSLPKDKFGVGIATFTLAQAMCQAIAPSIGLFLAERMGYPFAFAVAAGCTLCAVVVACLMKEPVREAVPFRISRQSIVAKEAAFPATIMFLLQFAFGNINAFLVIYAGKLGVEHIGYYFTVYALSMLLAPRICGHLADRYGTSRALIPALGCFAAAFVLISVSNGLWMFLLAAVLSAFGYGAAQPTVQALCMKSVTPDRRGAASNTSYIGQDLGNLLGPVAAGAVVESLGYESMWRIMVVPIALALVLVIASKSRIRQVEVAFSNRA